MLPVTSLLAPFLALMLVALSFIVSLNRAKTGTDLGMGTDDRLLRAIRAQGNFIEYAPMALILCALAEYRGASITWLMALSLMIAVGRVAHAAGMYSGSTVLRASGMVMTYGAILVGAAALVFA